MTKPNKDSKESDGGMFRILEVIVESIGWLQIMISPFLLGIVIAAFIYFTNPSIWRLIIGIIIVIIGLVAGIALANKQWYGKGTIWFLSRTMATPELDKPGQEDNEKH